MCKDSIGFKERASLCSEQANQQERNDIANNLLSCESGLRRLFMFYPQGFVYFTKFKRLISI